MNLKTIKELCPDFFTYRNKDFIMVHYGMDATHRGKRSDTIVWESKDKKTYIHYEKGYIYAENENGEIFAEVEE
jgi:hypothetical protein